MKLGDPALSDPELAPLLLSQLLPYATWGDPLELDMGTGNNFFGNFVTW